MEPVTCEWVAAFDGSSKMSLVNSRKPIESRKLRIVKKQSSMAALSKEFADSTSMHGLKFISQDDASLPERHDNLKVYVIRCFESNFALD